MTPEDFVAATADPFQYIGAAHYFHDVSRKVADELGLDLFRFYFCGRGGVLGDVDAAVVQSAFGYFNPKLLGKMWTTGADRCSVAEASAGQMRVIYELGEAGLGDVDGLGDAATSLQEITSVVDASALTLFAGFQALDQPESDAARFMHQVVLMRELRGSVHLAALAAAGCPSRVAHQLKRPNDGEMFGWTDTVPVSDADQAAFDQAGALTDAAMVRHVGAITDDARAQVAVVAAAAAERVSI